MNKENFEILAIISARKGAYYVRAMEALKHKAIDSSLEKDIMIKVRKIIASLPNELFIGASEESTKKIDPTSKIEKLGLDNKKIMAIIVGKLRLTYENK